MCAVGKSSLDQRNQAQPYKKDDESTLVQIEKQRPVLRPHELGNLSFLWKAPHLIFGEDQSATDFNVEYAFAFSVEGDIKTRYCCNLCGHTVCLGTIVSLRAVTNINFHKRTPVVSTFLSLARLAENTMGHFSTLSRDMIISTGRAHPKIPNIEQVHPRVRSLNHQSLEPAFRVRPRPPLSHQAP